MNTGLRKAYGQRVLFLDDDIIPANSLVDAHIKRANLDLNAVIAGRVLQPWHNGKADDEDSPFLFNSLTRKEVSSFIGCNVSVPRELAIGIGGFDTNFVRVAYQYEAEFSYRWIQKGRKVLYEPDALIQHLRAERGGTRSYGLHLETIKPDHAVGRYYFNFCTRPVGSAIIRSIRDCIRCVLTKHHARNPHWIPLTLIAEIRGLIWAIILYNTGKGLLNGEDIDLLVVASHPVQYTSQFFKDLNHTKGMRTQVLYLTIPDSKSQSLGFKKEFVWDIPLLEGYEYICANRSTGKGLASGFTGVRVADPLEELKNTYRPNKPDVVLLTGWHFWGMVQMFICLTLAQVPIILRMDSNGVKQRNVIHQKIYEIFFSYVKICLVVGKENETFCLRSGLREKQLIRCPHIVDNDFFASRSRLSTSERERLRHEWAIGSDSFCFIFAGKFQTKKRPFDLLHAFKEASKASTKDIHLLMVGSGKLENECKSFVKESNIRVTFTGFLNQTEIPIAYAVSDCIVLPSNHDETWGLVVNEAMACALPAIVSDQVGCMSDLIKEGVTGFSYKCGDIRRLTELIHYMSHNQEQAKLMGRNAKSMIFAEYNLAEVVRGIEKAVSCIHADFSD
jgi:glycosyltransferase involved in cell wall biosynthesis